MKPFLFLLAIASLTACSQGNAADEITGTPDQRPRPQQPQRPDPEDVHQGEKEQAVNFYSRGTLVEGDVLPAEGAGFVKIHRPRNRGYGSYDLLEIIKDVSSRLQALYPSRDRIQVGDVSQVAGGQISGHVSHQNGLDADIAFLRVNQTEQHPDDTTGFRESFVEHGRLTANFDMPRNWAFAKLLIATGRVQRIFVNEVVRKAFCEHARQTGELESAAETIRRLRIAAGHTDHFHIRVTCPLNSPRCTPQEEVPAGDGC